MQQRAPAVYEWVARLWNSSLARMPGLPAPLADTATIPLGWGSLLPIVGRYLTYLEANARAWQAGLDSFVCNGCEVPTVAYRVWCRRQLQERFLTFDPPERAVIEAVLRQHRCWTPLFGSATTVFDAELRSHIINCPPEGGVEPPFCQESGQPEMLGYKWPAKPLLKRYMRQRLAPRAAVVMLLLWFLLGRPRVRRAVFFILVFYLGKLSK